MSANVLRRELALFTEGPEAEGKKRGRRHLEKVVKKSKHASQDETAVDLYKKTNVDHTARNLEYFQHSSSTAKSVSNQVMLQNAGRKAKDRKLKEEKRKEENVFTEQDFKRFQREYFGKH